MTASSLRPNDAAHPFKVVVLGGAYAGLAAAINLTYLCDLKDGPSSRGTKNTCTTPFHVEVTVVDERDGYYHLIGSPMVMASTDYAKTAWVEYKDVPAVADAPNITTLQGKVTGVDCAGKTVAVKTSTDATTVPFDFLIVATGLRRGWPVVPTAVTKEAYLAQVTPQVAAVSSAPDGVLVVGGGAVGIEMAAELKLAQPQTKVTLAHSRALLMSAEPFESKVGEKTAEILREGGVELLLEHRLKETRPIDDGKAQEVVFTNGHTMRASQVLRAMSNPVPETSFLPKEAVNTEGYVKITPSLFFPDTIPNADSILAAGDLVDWSGLKRCGRAMHMGYLTAHNVHQRMQQQVLGVEPQFESLKEIPAMIAIAIGKQALAYTYGTEFQYGTDVADSFFEHDVGFRICWDHLGLGVSPKDAKEEKKL